MSYDIDQVLAEIRSLTERIESLPAGERREDLEVQREELRATARLAADAARPTSNLRAELDNVESQLATIDHGLIRPALNEHYKVVTDPSAYRRRINQRIRRNEAARLAALEQRRAELLAALEAQRTD